jgi:hypothetical protein
MGYIGPSRTPMSETATAPPIRDGTSHTTSSSLGVVESAIQRALSGLKEKSEPDSEEHVDEYCQPLAYLWGDASEFQALEGYSRKYLIVDPQESNSTYSQASGAA